MAGVAVELIDTSVVIEGVVTITAMELVLAGATIEDVVAGVTVENIVAAPTGEGVVTAVAKEGIGTVGTCEVVVGGVALAGSFCGQVYSINVDGYIIFGLYLIQSFWGWRIPRISRENSSPSSPGVSTSVIKVS